MSEGGVTLVVRAAEKCDAGHGIARLPKAARRALGVFSGETVVIKGSRETVAKIWPVRPGTTAGGMLVDADTRTNTGMKIGDSVRVRRITIGDARSVTLVGPSAFERISVDRETIEKVMKAELRNHPVREGDRVRIERLGGTALAVSETALEGVVRITDVMTVFVTVTSSKDASEAVRGAIKSMTGSDDGGDDGSRGRATGITYEDIDGLDDELDLVREMIELPLSRPEVFTHLSIESSKGVLLHGPPGTGETLIARTVANEVDASFTTVSGPKVLSRYKGGSEEKPREVLQSARKNAPAIILFDEIDSIASRHDGGDDLENRVVGQLLSLMDGLDARDDVVVVGVMDRVNSLDPALRQGGRFDREIEIGVPNEAGRREIFDMHTQRVPLTEGVGIDRLASRTRDFVDADLESLAREAAVTALRYIHRKGGGGSGDGDEKVVVADITITRADFESTMATVEPSAMRKYVAEQPAGGLEDVGGLDDVERTLERAVTWPLTYAPLFEAASTNPPTGLFLHGPPEIGKATLARAITAEGGVNFVHVAGSELLDHYVDESEKPVREVFDRARQVAPSTVFFGGIGVIATDRDSAGPDSGVSEHVVSQLLTEMDNAADNLNLVVPAVTNRRDALDPALLRPGRLGTHIEVPAPNIEACRVILDVYVRGKPLDTDMDLGDVATHMDGYTGADVTAVCREAALRATQGVADAYDGAEANEHVNKARITRTHFDVALKSVSPTRV